MTGVSGFPTEWEGIPVLPSGLTGFSADILGEHARHFFGSGPGLVIIHYDAWAIGAEAVRGLAVAGYSPVHSEPMSAGDQAFYALSGAVPIAYSRFGEREMRKAGLSPLYVPHGEDTALFRPLDDAERAEVRRRIGVPEDAFLVAVIAANKGVDPPRKAWGEHLAAFAQFRKRHKDAVMVAHTMAAVPPEWGLDLRPLIANLGLGDAVVFSDDYAQVAGLYPAEYIARLAGCADVVSNPSYGEGFGLAALHAQACGVPVIVGNNSAQTELCGAGWKVACQPYWHHRDQAWWHTPIIKSIVAALEKSYRHARDPGLRAKAREFALGYDADLVTAQYWKPALEMLEQYAGAARVRSPGRNHGTVPLPTVKCDGLRWLSRGYHTDDWIAVGHEDALAPVLDSLLPEGGVLLDVGAHVGRWSLRLAAKASKVIAVEPNPDTAAVLRYHIGLNQVTNVTVIEAAAWDEPARLRLEDPNRKVTGGSTRVLAAEDGTVDALPLDAVLEDEDRIDLVKLDVEGADLHALAGMAGTLARLWPVLFIEDHSIYGYYERDDLLAVLEEMGYQGQVVTAMLAGGRTAPYVIARPCLTASEMAEAQVTPA
jgi:FkbM family methyltransferase